MHTCLRLIEMRRRSTFLLPLVFSLLSPTAFSAETTEAVPIFESPSYSSKQIEILPPKSRIQIKGKSEAHGDGAWLPVQTDRGSGWAPSSGIELGEKDAGYVNWPGRGRSPWIWFSGGPSIM